MPKKEYFVITADEGDVRITAVDEATLLSRLRPDPEDPGYVYWRGDAALDHIPDNDPNYWHGRFLIIKGEIIVPKSKRVVVDYEL